MDTTDHTDQIQAAVRAMAAKHDTAIYLPDMFRYANDADAKLHQLAIDGHIVPTRCASTGVKQVWEFEINGDAYMLTTQDTGETWEGFEPRDSGSFDRLVADMADPDIYSFVA